MNLQDLLWAVPRAWNDDTRVAVQGMGNHPAAGQSVPSSLLIQKHFGGQIVFCEVGGSTYNRTYHWFNDLDGVMVDVTRAQFKNQLPYRKFKKVPLNNKWPVDTWQRVDLLEDRVLDLLANRG